MLKNRDLVLEALSDSGTVAPLIMAANFHSRANPNSYMYVFAHPKATQEYSGVSNRLEPVGFTFFFSINHSIAIIVIIINIIFTKFNFTIFTVSTNRIVQSCTSQRCTSFPRSRKCMESQYDKRSLIKSRGDKGMISGGSRIRKKAGRKY